MEQVPLFSLDGHEAKVCLVSDFAKVHGVPVQTLYSATSSGRILHTRIHGRLFLNHESAEKFMQVYRKYTTEEK